jgi:transposase
VSGEVCDFTLASAAGSNRLRKSHFYDNLSPHQFRLRQKHARRRAEADGDVQLCDTLEFKQEAVRLVESGQTMAAAARSLGVVEQTLGNWIKLHRAGALKGVSGRMAVTAEQMEISRLRAELARVTMERDILGKATAFCVVRRQNSIQPRNHNVLTVKSELVPETRVMS